MEPKKLRLLLIVGVAAMVVSVVCFIGVSSLMQQINSRANRMRDAETVIGDLTWDEILATSSHRRTQQEQEEASAAADEASAAPSAAQAAAATASEAPEASEAASATPAPTASAAASASRTAAVSASAAVTATPKASAAATATARTTAAAPTAVRPGVSSVPAAVFGPTIPPKPTLAPAARPTVLIGGGLVPYDDRKFDVTGAAVPEAGFMKVITITRNGTMRAQDITWEMDVSDSDDIHVTISGERLGDKDPLKTGALVELYDGDRVIDTAVVVIPGDVTGTGEVNAAQVAALQKAISDPDSLEGAFLLAGDLDGNGKIEQADVTLLRERIAEE